MLNTLHRIFVRKSAVIPLVGILAIAATACEGVGLTEARQAVDNQREINEIEEREIRPIQDEFDALYENDILPRERELEDLWGQVNDLQNGGFGDPFADYQDPWAPGGEAYDLQQEFQVRYAEIDRQVRELDVESRKLQIDMQWTTDTSNGADPALTALEDQRFSLQRELDRLHQFGRRPIEDIYLQMNELNATNGWSQTDIYAADDLNRKIADAQNQIAQLQSSGAHANGQLQQELISVQNELDRLRTQGYIPINELYNRIAVFEQQWQVTVAVAADGTVINPDASAELEILENELAELISPLQERIDQLTASFQVIVDDAQASIDALHPEAADTTSTPEADAAAALQAEIEALGDQIAAQFDQTEAVVVGIDASILALEGQMVDQSNATNATVADLVSQAAALQTQIDALDPEAEDYATVLAGLEAELDVVEADVATANSDGAAAIAAIQSQVDGLISQKADEQANRDSAVADLQAQIDTKLAELDAATTAASSTVDSTGSVVSQEILDQIAVIEQERDTSTAPITGEMDDLNLQILNLRDEYEPRIAELRASSGSGTNSAGVVTTGIADDPAGTAEIQSLRDQALRMEQELSNQIQVMEDKQRLLLDSMNGTASTEGAVQQLEAELVRLHDELNALQNSGFDASRQYNIRTEELQQETVRLEKQLSIDIRALEDRIWELDGQINDYYRSNNGKYVDPYAETNTLLKEIELKKFDLEQARWALDDEQQTAYNQFNDVGSAQKLEAEAEQKDTLSPLYARIDVLEEELRELRITQRDIEDRLRAAQKLVDEQRRELEEQTLDLIDEAVSSAEANGTGLEGLIPEDAGVATTE